MNGLTTQARKQTSPVKLLIDHGAYRNAGDIAMLEAVVARCHQKFPGVQLFVIKGDFESFVWQMENVVAIAPYFIRPLYKKILWKFSKKYYHWMDKFLSGLFTVILSRTSRSTVIYWENQKLRLKEFCSQFDGYLVTGGGNLNDIFYKVLFAKMVLIRGFLQQQKAVMLTGQQLGPIKSALYRNAARQIFKKVSYLGLRDPGESVRFCTQAGLSPERFCVMGDDSLALVPARQQMIQEFLQANDLIPGKFIAINLRIVWYAVTDKKRLSNVIVFLTKLSSALSMPLLFVPISMAEHDSDLTAAKGLQKELKSMRILQLPEPNPAAIKALLGQAFGSVGTSFHFCTFSLCQGVPAVCIYQGDYYAQKARSLELFWQEIGLGLDIRTLTNKSVERIHHFFIDDFVRDRLLKKSQRAKMIWEQSFDAQMSRIFDRN